MVTKGNPITGVCWRRSAHKLFLGKDPIEDGFGEATLMDKVILDNRERKWSGVEDGVCPDPSLFFLSPLYPRFPEGCMDEK